MRKPRKTRKPNREASKETRQQPISYKEETDQIEEKDPNSLRDEDSEYSEKIQIPQRKTIREAQNLSNFEANLSPDSFFDQENSPVSPRKRNLAAHFSTKPCNGEASPEKYSRKDKSLGELCKRFIYLYGSFDYTVIALDECTRKLEVERRRIYDIINILESFNVLSRKAKNLYEWRGVAQIRSSVLRVQAELTSQPGSKDSSPAHKKKKSKSLGILCQSFIK